MLLQSEQRPILLLPTTIFILPEPKKHVREVKDIDETKTIESYSHEPENTANVKGLSSKWIITICYALIFALMFIYYLGPSQISFYIEDLGLEMTSFQIGIIMAATMVAAAITGATYKLYKK